MRKYRVLQEVTDEGFEVKRFVDCGIHEAHDARGAILAGAESFGTRGATGGRFVAIPSGNWTEMAVARREQPVYEIVPDAAPMPDPDPAEPKF